MKKVIFHGTDMVKTFGETKVLQGINMELQEAYTSNLDDTWGVDVYFWITKTLE